MEIQKELSALALNISEEEYRNSEELHYSTISTYDEKGFNGLDHLFDKKESASLSFGSCVDCIATEGIDAFRDKFIVADINVTEGGMNTCKQLIEMHLPYSSFEEIPKTVVSGAAQLAGFYAAEKFDKTRYDKVLATGNVAEYYSTLLHADKEVISTEMYNDALACVRALKESPVTSGYFADNDPFSPVRRYYQLKFRATIDAIGYICMFDLLVVDYDKKIIYPCDLKTMWMPEWDFEINFKKFHYSHQARLYWKVLRVVLDNDPYFKDFTVENFRFIVVNKDSLIPLVWKFPYTKLRGTLVTDDGTEVRDPFEIGKELKGYLNLRPPVPNGINKDGINIINCLKPKAD